MLVSLPNPLINGTTAFGSEVKANDDSIVAVVNGGIDNDNMRTGADAAGKGLTTDKYANASVTTAKIADGNVTAVKLADDGTPGDGCNLSELWTGSGEDGTNSYPPTNINAGRKQQGGKTIWTYFNIPIASLNTDFLIDNSIDWRNRLVTVIAEGTVAATKADIPGGANDGLITGPLWTGGGSVGVGMNGGIFYTQAGQATGAGALPALTFNINAATDTIRFYARAADGFLMARMTANAATGLSICAKIDCSPRIE